MTESEAREIAAAAGGYRLKGLMARRPGMKVQFGFLANRMNEKLREAGFGHLAREAEQGANAAAAKRKASAAKSAATRAANAAAR